MIYLLIFYWIFAALFCFGAVYDGRHIVGVFSGCLVLGGIFFPLFLGRSINPEDYE